MIKNSFRLEAIQELNKDFITQILIYFIKAIEVNRTIINLSFYIKLIHKQKIN